MINFVDERNGTVCTKEKPNTQKKCNESENIQQTSGVLEGGVTLTQPNNLNHQSATK